MTSCCSTAAAAVSEMTRGPTIRATPQEEPQTSPWRYVQPWRQQKESKAFNFKIWGQDSLMLTVTVLMFM